VSDLREDIADGGANSAPDRTAAASETGSDVPNGELRQLGFRDWEQVDLRRYQVAGEHGRGGLGRVLVAWDKRLDRSVALKELLQAGPQGEARFLREALITARLEHPAIVPVHDVGRWPSGKPFYAMKLVSGASLASLIDRKRTLEERLALLPNVIATADAMAYAHQRGVIHRDLKPSNVLVGPFGETLVIDWGLACDLSKSGDAHQDAAGPYEFASLGITLAGSVVGTPQYMPPEQAAGSPVDARADVYAIGAILYQLLAGEPPFVGPTSAEVLKSVLHDSPVSIETHQPGAPEELCTIVHKAMARDPKDRYATAKELAEELKRFQTGQLVRSHSYSTVALVRRWLARHRAAVGIGLSLMCLLVATTGFSVRRILRERDRAERERVAAQQALALADDRNDELLLANARSVMERDPTLALAMIREFPHLPKQWKAIREIAANAVSHGVARHVFRHPGQGNVVAVAFAGNSNRLASASFDGSFALWNLADGAKVSSGQHKGRAHAIAVSDDGQKVFSAGEDGEIQILDVPTGLRRILRGHEGPIWDVSLSADQKTLASAGSDGTVRIWDLETERGRVLDRHEKAAYQVRFSSDGRFIASSGEDGAVRVWSTATRHSRRVFRHRAHVYTLAVSPDGDWVASGSLDQSIHVWNTRSNSGHILRGHESEVSTLAFSPDSRTLFSGGKEGAIRSWDLLTGEGRVWGTHQGGSEPWSSLPMVLSSPRRGSTRCCTFGT